MSRTGRYVLLFVVFVVFAFAAGNLCGLYFYPRLFAKAASEYDHDHHHTEHSEHEHTERGHAEHGHEEHEHLALTKQAFENMQLQLGTVTRGDYWKSLTVPGEVVEIVGKSDLTISAPLAGVIEQVSALEGQAIGPAENLFTMRITDENLTRAQLDLLTNLARQEVVQQEIARLHPLTEAGTVSGQRKRELEYERAQLDSTQAALRQKIRAFGLPDAALSDVVSRDVLATSVTVSAPTFLDTSGETRPVSATSLAETKDFSVERLHVHPGTSVERGDPLCNLVFHRELQIKGQAFESDMPILNKIAESGWKVRAEFGHDHVDGHSHATLVEGLELLRVDGRVDRTSQTFGFFLPLRNEIAKSSLDEQGRAFPQWKFKPGQRVHLKLPVEHWRDQWLLPRAAVVVEGPNAVVFVEHDEHESDPERRDHHDEHHDHEAHHDDVFIELEPVPVRLLYRDSRMAVIADDGQLTPQQRVALNSADKLQLALKMQSMGGGGHHHHHH